MSSRPLILALLAAACILQPASAAQPKQPQPQPASFYSGWEQVLAAEFELKRWQERMLALRTRADRLAAEVDRLWQQGQITPGDPNDTKYQMAVQALERTKHDLEQIEPAVREAELKLEQIRQVQSLRSGPLVNIRFPGGTVEEYVAAVKDASPGRPINILVGEEVKSWYVGPVALEHVSIGTAMQAIPAAAPKRGQLWQVEEIGMGEQGAPIYRVGSGGFGPEQPASTTRVHSLTALLVEPDGYRPEAVLAAVEAALTVGARESQPVDVKFHRDTNLLLVSGSRRELQVVEEVLGELLRNFERQRTQDWARRESMLERQAAVRKAEIDVRSARSQMELVEQRFQTMRQMEKTGSVSQDELLKMQSAVAGTRADVERAEVAFELARGKLEMFANPQPPTPRAPESPPPREPAPPPRGR